MKRSKTTSEILISSLRKFGFIILSLMGIGIIWDVLKLENMLGFKSPEIQWNTLASLATFVTALLILAQLRITINQMKASLIKQKIEEFYLPLIELFSSDIPKGDKELIEIERLLSKRHLCSPDLLNVLPHKFTVIPPHKSSNSRPTGGIVDNPLVYFYFIDEQELKRWQEVADKLWGEYVELVEEYYRLSEYNPDKIVDKLKMKKPEWKFKPIPKQHSAS